MTRYILIDSNSGYIFGDSASLKGMVFEGTPAEFARALDESNKEYNRQYEEMSFSEGTRSGYSGYLVYRADDPNFPVVGDGQDQEMIDRVDQDCVPVCFIKTSRNYD